MTTSLDDIVANFELLDEWDDRYRYLIELGKGLEPLSEAAHNDVNKVRGCASQVWLDVHREGGPGPQTRLHFLGDSDAHLTPQRSNGVRAMIDRIKNDARAAAAG